jgi:hypothetical protein
MSAPLESARAKLDWAGHHLEVFRTELDQWRPETGPISIRLQPDPDAGKNSWVGVPTSLPDVPNRFSLIIGDFVQNLRACLDHIAYVLADLNSPGRGPDNSTQFPILKSPGDWTNKLVKRWIQYLSAADIDAMKKIQPYNAADRPVFARLALIKALSNRDKHRRINTVAAAPQGGIAMILPVRDCRVPAVTNKLGALEVGTPCLWFEVIPTGSEPEVKVHPISTLSIAVAEEEGGPCELLLPGLLRAGVTVVRLFERMLAARGRPGGHLAHPPTGGRP